LANSRWLKNHSVGHDGLYAPMLPSLDIGVRPKLRTRAKPLDQRVRSKGCSDSSSDRCDRRVWWFNVSMLVYRTGFVAWGCEPFCAWAWNSLILFFPVDIAMYDQNCWLGTVPSLLVVEICKDERNTFNE
jgi:hypothetical protein